MEMGLGDLYIALNTLRTPSGPSARRASSATSRNTAFDSASRELLAPFTLVLF
jgi:hypothetical protein